MNNTLKSRSLFAFIFFVCAAFLGGCQGRYSTPMDLYENQWAANKRNNIEVGIVCESISDRFSSCYVFTGNFATTNEQGVTILIDNDGNVFQFSNMSCVVAPASQIGDTACEIDVCSSDIE